MSFVIFVIGLILGAIVGAIFVAAISSGVDASTQIALMSEQLKVDQAKEEVANRDVVIQKLISTVTILRRGLIDVQSSSQSVGYESWAKSYAGVVLQYSEKTLKDALYGHDFHVADPFGISRDVPKTTETERISRFDRITADSKYVRASLPRTASGVSTPASVPVSDDIPAPAEEPQVCSTSGVEFPDGFRESVLPEVREAYSGGLCYPSGGRTEPIEETKSKRGFPDVLHPSNGRNYRYWSQDS